MASASLSTQLLVWLAAYLIGSVSFAVLVSRMMGLADPHSYGSGNPGATNVLRTGNRKAALYTLLGDVGKGVVAVLLARWLAPTLGLSQLAIMGVGLAAFLGHLYPVFHRFAGGKGVATAAGVLLALNPLHGLAVLATWLVVARVSRYSSLAALTAAAMAPIYWGLFYGIDASTLTVLIMSLLLIWRHRSNIGNLLEGKESKIGSKKNDAAAQQDTESADGHHPHQHPLGPRKRKHGHRHH
ncbi:MAG: glycerol-3-phosphate 1-O-acyltransferase PlsY [Lautropia sp.]|nr:glycerol-3-phosphate 1-O-acyltransferase PlsY [Lautropia sp.]